MTGLIVIVIKIKIKITRKAKACPTCAAKKYYKFDATAWGVGAVSCKKKG